MMIDCKLVSSYSAIKLVPRHREGSDRMIELRFSDLIPLYKSVGESVCSLCRSGGRRTGGIQDHSVSLKLFPIFPGQGHVREIANIPQISKDSLFGTNSGVGEKS